MEKYSLPDFLQGTEITKEKYKDWLRKKAQAHVRRDRKRGNKSAKISEYKEAMHEAVTESEGKDFYTGELLKWNLIGEYDNECSKEGKSEYKKKFAMLPTIDHASGITKWKDFKICSWRTNDAKNDLSYKDFLKLCRKVIEYSTKVRI